MSFAIEMSQQGPILVIPAGDRRHVAAAVTDALTFPVMEIGWREAADAVKRIRPAAVIADVADDQSAAFDALATMMAAEPVYVPLIVVDPRMRLPPNALPVSSFDSDPERLRMRLRAALRVRDLHITMLRRIGADRSTTYRLPEGDPIHDATALLIGRGATYPALSVALGERMGVVGALSIEAAAKHLNARDLDGIVIGDGFSSRVINAFLTVLAEDPRFRNLPIIIPPGAIDHYDLANLDMAGGEPAHVTANAVPLIRQRAFEQRIVRTLKSIDAGGLLDPRTGLLTAVAFDRDFAAAVNDAHARGSGLAVAQLTFDSAHPRMQLDAARIVSRLMRRTDFGSLRDDGVILTVFVDSDLRTAEAIARRLASVMKHTMYSARRGSRIDPHVAVDMLTATDSAESLLARLDTVAHRAAS